MSESGVNLRPRGWDSRHERAAERLADGQLTDVLIAEEAGLTVSRLGQLKHQPYFRSRVEHYLSVAQAAIEAEGIANRANRVASQNERWRKLHQVVSERAADPVHQRIPGYRTGLLVHTVKGIGKGEDFRVIDLYEVDAALLRELRELEKHAATELGQWEEKSKHSGSLNVLQQIVELEVTTPPDQAPAADS